MALVQVINVDDVPDVFQLLASDEMKRLSDNICERINARSSHLNAFADYRAERDYFVNNIVKASQNNVAKILQQNINKGFFVDSIYPITSTKDLLAGISERMKEIILTSRPIRRALEKDEIYGFGMKPEDLPRRDPYKHLTNNGPTNSKGISLRVVTSEDPDLSVDNMIDIKATRRFVEELLEEGIDPTDYPSPVGNIR